MIVRIKHEKHGFHHVYTPQELEKAKLNGWVEDIEPTPKQTVKLKKGDKCQSQPILSSKPL